MKKTIISIFLVLALTGCNNVYRTSNYNENNLDNNQTIEPSTIEEHSNITNENNEVNEDDEIKESEYVHYNSSYNDWLKSTKEDEYVITLIGATYCGHCVGFKPIIENVADEYNIPLYFYYINEINESEYALITNEYETNYEGSVPHMFITKNGRVISNITGSMGKDKLIEFLKLNMVIE